MGSLASRQPMCSAGSSATYLTPDASEIIMASLDKKTKTAYLKVWKNSQSMAVGTELMFVFQFRSFYY